MTFPDAVAVLVAGGKVRRAKWQHPGVFLFMARLDEQNDAGECVREPLETSDIRIRALFGPPVAPWFNHEDLTATDWETTEEPEPGPDEYSRPNKCPCRSWLYGADWQWPLA